MFQGYPRLVKMSGAISKESLVDMYIYILNIHKILYFSDPFFRSADAVNKSSIFLSR